MAVVDCCQTALAVSSMPSFSGMANIPCALEYSMSKNLAVLLDYLDGIYFKLLPCGD